MTFDQLVDFASKLWWRHLREPNRKKRRRMRKWFNHLARRLLRINPQFNIKYLVAEYDVKFEVTQTYGLMPGKGYIIPIIYEHLNTGPTPNEPRPPR